jgi:imidazolonepropionase-like amidohydrolase
LAYNEALDALEIVTNGSILIEGDRIKAISKSDSPLQDLPPGIEVINVEGNIISPGFVDTHRHGCRCWGRNPFPIPDCLMIFSRDIVPVLPKQPLSSYC